jgi:alpha-ketoglutarate-dependent taurine dioxygenase
VEAIVSTLRDADVRRLGAQKLAISTEGCITTLSPLPGADMSSFRELARGARHQLLELLDTTGALRLRGFDIDSADAFEAVLFQGLGLQPLFDSIGSSEAPEPSMQRRASLGRAARGNGQVYDLPTERELQGPHIEHGWRSRRGRYIAFWCEHPPSAAGETALFDMSLVYDRLDDTLKSLFDNFASVYPTYGEEFPVDSVLLHPRTGRKCLVLWYYGEPLAGHAVRAYLRTAHGAKNPVASIGPQVRASITELRHDLVRGSERIRLSDEQTARLMDICYDVAQYAVWQRSDLLIIDNIRLAHGRMPSEGPRALVAGYANEEDMRRYAANPSRDVPGQDEPISESRKRWVATAIPSHAVRKEGRQTE